MKNLKDLKTKSMDKDCEIAKKGSGTFRPSRCYCSNNCNHTECIRYKKTNKQNK